jgi:hypothetical protein
MAGKLNFYGYEIAALDGDALATRVGDALDGRLINLPLRMTAVGTLAKPQPDLGHLGSPAVAQIILFSLATLLFTLLAVNALHRVSR